jgi:hypothetical protein
MTAFSLNHLVCRDQQRFLDGEAERFGGLEVYDQIKLGRPPATVGGFENRSDLKIRPRSCPSRPSPLRKPCPSLGHALTKAAVKTRQDGGVLGQLHEGLHDLRLRLRYDRRPAAAGR